MNKITYWLAICTIVLHFDYTHAQGVVLNELLTSNANSITDENNDHEDWIELYNASASPLSLLGYGLTDDATQPFKWVFPSVTLNPGEYLVVWASDKNRRVPWSPLHTNFKISAAGESITLTSPSGTLVNSIPATTIPTDVSYGRFPNGTGAFVFFNAPTPNAENATAGFAEALSPPVFSQESGFFTSDFSLNLSSPQSDVTIYYTLDGSEPDENNLSGTTYQYKNQYPEEPGQAFGAFLQNTFQTLTYSTPIAISNRTSQPNKVSAISTTWDFDPPYIPNGPVFKGTVVKAKVVKPGALPSKTVTKNYFVSPQGVNRFSLPVVSISLDENKFYDYTDGISVAGIDFDNWRLANPTEEINENLGNFNRSGDLYEREANLSYFVNGEEVINQKVGVRIHGDYSRSYPSKSMRIYARSSYGADKLDYPLFSDEPYQAYERVVIKNSGSDFYNTMFRDALCNELVKDLRMETEAHQQVITFINGEYWGILAIRERYDNNYFKLVYDIPSDAIDLLENEGEAKEGDDIDYRNFFDYMENNDISIDANYNYIKTRMDTDNFIDYFTTNIYLNNDDWPGNNIVYWRKKTNGFQPGAQPGQDGRWRWAFHDVTSTFDDPELDALARATTTDDAVLPLWSTLLLRKLLENENFKIDFINRFADLMNTNFLPNRITAKIDEMAAVIAPEMNDQYFRWKAPVDNGDWQYHLNQERIFANQRPDYQREHLRTKFAIASNINVSLNVSGTDQGFVKINTINIKEGTPGITGNPYPWTGIYFHNIPITLKAEPLDGYVFSHWSGDASGTDSLITLTPTAAITVTAHFVPETPTEEDAVLNFWVIDTALPNDTPLEHIASTYEIASEAVLQYQSCLVGYPFEAGNPNWRKASMERRNSPTDINYFPEANGSIAFENSNMRGIQIKQPFQSGGLENTLIFNIPTTQFEDIVFAFAAKDEGAANGILVDYSQVVGAPQWTTANLSQSTLPLTPAYQRFVVDFSDITGVANNPDFKIRLRFTGPNMTADTGNRVTFNNFSVQGKEVALGRTENDITSFMVFPNPVSETLKVVHAFADVKYTLYTLDGKIIRQEPLTANQIDVSGLGSGLYLLQLETEGFTETKKIIKK